MAKGIIQLTSFFDLKEDGNLDIIIEYNKSDAPKIDFIKCDDKGDTTFLKVQIFSNVCTLDCPPPQYGPPNSEGIQILQ
jgi:hypothetical protein